MRGPDGGGGNRRYAHKTFLDETQSLWMKNTSLSSDRPVISVITLKQNEAQSAHAESTHKGVN